jgi:hypothetical protein
MALEGVVRRMGICVSPQIKALRHGLLLRWAFRRQADHYKRGYVDTEELSSYVRFRVMDMTKGLQEPCG